VYEAVTASLRTNDAKQQQAASALVVVMMQEPLRTQLLQVFSRSQSTTPEVRQDVDKIVMEEDRFRADQSTLAVRSLSATTAHPPHESIWETWDIDVFWCERSGEAARREAQEVVTRIRAEGARGRIRARLLPDTINAQPGYGIDGFAIRRHANDDKQVFALQKLAQAVIPGSAFDIQTSGMPLQWYISAFICPPPIS